MSDYWSPKVSTDYDVYGFKWARRLGADTIVTSDWTVLEGDVVLNNNVVNGLITSTGVNGGTVGVRSKIRNTITSGSGKTLSRSAYLRIL